MCAACVLHVCCMCAACMLHVCCRIGQNYVATCNMVSFRVLKRLAAQQEKNMRVGIHDLASHQMMSNQCALFVLTDDGEVNTMPSIHPSARCTCARTGAHACACTHMMRQSVRFSFCLQMLYGIVPAKDLESEQANDIELDRAPAAVSKYGPFWSVQGVSAQGASSSVMALSKVGHMLALTLGSDGDLKPTITFTPIAHEALVPKELKIVAYPGAVRTQAHEACAHVHTGTHTCRYTSAATRAV